MLSLLAAVCIGSISYLGSSSQDSFLKVSSAVGSVDTPTGSRKTSPDEANEHSLSEMVDREDQSAGISQHYRLIGITFSCVMNVILWVLLISRKRREIRDKDAEREAEREARKSPEEVLHRKRRQMLRLLDEGFGDLIEDRITVRSVMTQEVTVCRASNSAKLIQEKMSQESLRNVLVVDQDNRLIGLLTRADIPRGARESVQVYMTRDPVSIRPDMRLSECIKTFIEQGVSTIPVTANDGSICGAVLIRDALLLLQAVQVVLHGNREELSKIFFCQRNSTSISDIIASTLREDGRDAPEEECDLIEVAEDTTSPT